MNLFWLKLFGKLMSTEKMELHMAQVAADIQRYRAVEQSKELAEYNELTKVVTAPAFKLNKKKMKKADYQSSEEYQQELRYAKLKKNEDILFFEKTDHRAIEHYESFQTTFEDNFAGKVLDSAKWTPGFHYANPNLKRVHSFLNEQQANMGGKNIAVLNGTMYLSTCAEQVQAAAWTAGKRGFDMKEYNYSSDVLTTGDNFRQKGGLFMAKMRCTGHIHHAFWLGANQQLPLVSVFHFNGKKITVGNAGAKKFDATTITGISANEFFIYSLRWTKTALIWYVNNMEVYRTAANIPQEEMYLAFNSFITATQKAEEGNLEVEWVKVFQVNE